MDPYDESSVSGGTGFGLPPMYRSSQLLIPRSSSDFRTLSAHVTSCSTLYTSRQRRAKNRVEAPLPNSKIRYSGRSVCFKNVTAGKLSHGSDRFVSVCSTPKERHQGTKLDANCTHEALSSSVRLARIAFKKYARARRV